MSATTEYKLQLALDALKAIAQAEKLADALTADRQLTKAGKIANETLALLAA